MTLRLYSDLAHLWPIISPPEEYMVEAQEWLDVIRGSLDAAPTDRQSLPTLLELGCGGGHLLSHLTAHFITEAVDLSPQMLEISRQLNPQTLHHLGDMRDVRLGHAFDVVAIHDAINYMTTEDDLQAAIATAETHLNPGGVLLLAPDCVQETFEGPRVVEWTQRSRGPVGDLHRVHGQAAPRIHHRRVGVRIRDRRRRGTPGGGGPAHGRPVPNRNLC